MELSLGAFHLPPKEIVSAIELAKKAREDRKGIRVGLNRKLQPINWRAIWRWGEMGFRPDKS